MRDQPLLVQRDGVDFPSAVLRYQDDWGLRTADIVNPPARIWGEDARGLATVETAVDVRRLKPLPLPSELLQTLPADDNWSAQTRRTLARLHAYFLLVEDPQRRLDARPVTTLAHQVSLVQHILENEHLNRVLIADEVGLGKTVEAGLLIKEWLARRPGLRVLYLAPARLVNNVRTEFDRLGLAFRQWSSDAGDARWTDPLIIASIHRAVHNRHLDKVLSTDPWDVVVVDECHHLSAWTPGGGDPTLNYRLVRDLIARQIPDSRVVLLSGTPHQGHLHRFENLLHLLRKDDEPIEALQGRVIYRTKDDVRDWFDQPLFPQRSINEPLVFDLGVEYRAWLQAIHRFYRPQGQGDGSDARKRAMGWRCAQSLQWAVSSPQAGLGYLTRQALRLGWRLDQFPMAEVVAALRPYRHGNIHEPVDQLYQRLLREVDRQDRDGDIDDIEEADLPENQQQAQDRTALADLLVQGLQIVRSARDEKWQFVWDRVLDNANGEKVVLFAQPVETVTALAHFLERQTGRVPALIIGGQSDAERNLQVEAFRKSDGPQFLVSSRAGGEGINLQVARRLVHIDVPWNPMDMEQRIGRVHRFGSRRTILVDTLVVKDSREADAYRIARQKLERIASTMREPERFEALFSRVMCLVPPAELQDVLIHAPLAPINSDDQAEIARMVQKGFHSWNEFHERYSQEQNRIRQQNPGLAAWQDVASFLMDHAKATPAEGFTAQTFRWELGQIEAVESLAVALQMPDNRIYACGDYAGAPVVGATGSITPLGLNLAVVSDSLRRAAFPVRPAGAAYLRWPDNVRLPDSLSMPMGVLMFIRQTVKADPRGGWKEVATMLYCYCVQPDNAAFQIDGEAKASLIRGLLRGGIRVRPETSDPLLQSLVNEEVRLAQELRRPTQLELEQGVRHAVMPLAAMIVHA